MSRGAVGLIELVLSKALKRKRKEAHIRGSLLEGDGSRSGRWLRKCWGSAFFLQTIMPMCFVFRKGQFQVLNLNIKYRLYSWELVLCHRVTFVSPTKVDTIGILFRLFAVHSSILIQAKCEVVYPNGEAALADVKLTMSMNEVKAPFFFCLCALCAHFYISHISSSTCLPLPFIQLWSNTKRYFLKKNNNQFDDCLSFFQKSNCYLAGGNLNIFGIFTPKIGEDEPILTIRLFQMGWFNHEPGDLGGGQWSCKLGWCTARSTSLGFIEVWQRGGNRWYLFWWIVIDCGIF